MVWINCWIDSFSYNKWWKSALRSVFHFRISYSTITICASSKPLCNWHCMCISISAPRNGFARRQNPYVSSSLSSKRFELASLRYFFLDTVWNRFNLDFFNFSKTYPHSFDTKNGMPPLRFKSALIDTHSTTETTVPPGKASINATMTRTVKWILYT